MSTFTNTVLFDVTSDAGYRAAGAAIKAGLIGAGAVQTTDTGQIDWTTAVRGSQGYTGSNFPTSWGYEIYRLSDSLQATKPVFIKIEYGAQNQGNNLSWLFGIIVTVGTGTNGAGTLTGVVGTRRVVMSNNPNSNGFTPTPASAPTRCYYCIDGSSFTFALGIDSVPPTTVNGTPYSLPIVVAVERTRNLDGTANGDGVVFAYVCSSGVYSGGWTTFSGYQIINFTNSVVGAADGAIPVAFPGSAFNTGVAGQVITTYPIPVGTPTPEGQMLSLLGCYNNDIAIGVIVTINVFGVNHTYISLAQVNGTAGNNHSHFGSIWGVNVALMMKYE